ncbi:hypothetical protein BT69DRAFT_1344638 [Atractiella rhizophila]|nr:hypothetical protein BT69DRAFT_1344638 [Atractiella rhizophila]
MMAAAASLGLLCLWDVDVGMGYIDNYTYVEDDNIKAGATLANGLITASVKNENEAALALLGDKLDDKHVPTKVAAIVGLGVAYAGSNNETVSELLTPFASDTTVSMEVASMATLALGFVFMGSCNDEIAASIVQTMMERELEDLKSEVARYMALGLSLLYLGCRREEASEVIVELLKTIEAPVGKQTLVLIEACSFAGTGNVLKIQSMLHHCTDHLNANEAEKAENEAAERPSDANAAASTDQNGSVEVDKKEKEHADDAFQALAVLGLSLIGMGEDIGAEMLTRQFNHLMHYGEPVIRRSVPLALGFLSVGNPVLHIMDTLSKYSHDNDLDVAMNAIFAMGLLGAGTNNARLAQMLRQLATYYATQPECLFTVRIAMGLVHLGKGTITVNPFHTDRQLMSPAAVSGLLATLLAFTDTKFFILGKYPWMLYMLVTAMFPRFLITLDEEGNHQKVNVRVGQAVDVVGQAGKPRTITGFQTHKTPVRLGNTERAELATEEFISYASVLEGWCILAKNKGWMEEDQMS